MFPREAQLTWLDALSDEDVAFVKRFLLASGSLKDLATAYSVTYPTIRLRLDRLVEKIVSLDYSRSIGPFERMLVKMYADGKVDVTTMKALIAAHERELAVQSAQPKQSPKTRAPG